MDEIDAALDFKNVSIVANYIKERTRNAQFIIISLRAWPFCASCAWTPPSPPRHFFSRTHTPSSAFTSIFYYSPIPGNNMFELADRLVGIYKTKDVTKSVTINPKAMASACGLLQAEETMSLAAGGGGSLGAAAASSASMGGGAGTGGGL